MLYRVERLERHLPVSEAKPVVGRLAGWPVQYVSLQNANTAGMEADELTQGVQVVLPSSEDRVIPLGYFSRVSLVRSIRHKSDAKGFWGTTFTEIQLEAEVAAA